ncbi:MAG: alpha/beta hydrolase [Christensenellaceae bacterium]|jgi:pimeloyl-ACP methyl ester carboxylesterase|nr:alpha/beta hydrolase [Christensenellaceae bacterium]
MSLLKRPDCTIFYQKIGDAEKTVIFLHGNGGKGDLFLKIADKVAQNGYSSYLVDSRNHGKSSKVKPLNYADMACDVLALIEEEKLNKPIIYGFSDGAIVAALAAIKNSDAIGKIILSGINLTPDGILPSFRRLIKIGFFLTRSELLRLMMTQPNITKEDLKQITIPTVVLHAEFDIVSLDGSKTVAETVQNGELIIVPGEKHHTYVADSEKLYTILKNYI